MRGVVQVAGVRSVAEARMLVGLGVDQVGIPLRLAYHQPDVTEAQAVPIAEALGRDRAVLITYAADPHEIIELCQRLPVGWVQLHGNVTPQTIAAVRQAVAVRVIKSYVVGFAVEGISAFVERFAPVCDAFLTDTFDPRTGAMGATGRTHDWQVSRALVEASPLPVIVAGGLSPVNVAAAIALVRPAGVDAHTALEDDEGDKDPCLVRAFVREAKAAFARLEAA
ncbi:MAG: phosphoribosylanthranilate isomerase [Desulfomicrobiaceae bacterium]|nr:phosphoribosylanthranilate isomerase [Desulfomicrobiaceae bacterium]